MTPYDVRQRIAEFAQHAQTDPERFHSELDMLYRDVLRACRNDDPASSELASAALEAADIRPAWEACA